MWTTHAHHANWIFNLVRTSSEEKPQQGISFLLVDMQSPGVSVTPILSLTGDHEVNQVFFDDVRVPLENLVGAEGQGWEIATYLLEFERGGFVMNGFLQRKFERYCALAPDPLPPKIAQVSSSASEKSQSIYRHCFQPSGSAR